MVGEGENHLADEKKKALTYFPWCKIIDRKESGKILTRDKKIISKFMPY